MHATNALINPPKACTTLGIYIFNIFLAMTDFAIDGSISAYILRQSRNIFHCYFTSLITYLLFFKFYVPFRYLSSLLPLIYAWCSLNQLLKFKKAAKHKAMNLMVIADWCIWYYGIYRRSNAAKTVILSATQ